MFNFLRRQKEKKPKHTFILKASDAVLFLQAEKILNDDAVAPTTHSEILSDSIRLYDHFLLVTKKQLGHFSRVFNGHDTSYPVLDFPTFNGDLGFTLRIGEKDKNRLNEMKDLSGLSSTAQVWVHATRLYSTMIVDTHYGWDHRCFTPNGPDGGEPVFVEYVEKQKKGSVIRLSDYVPNRNDIAAQLL